MLLCELLLFRLRFESGLFKILSGDLSWRDLSAAGHYLETQPLPHVGAWYAHQLPDALLRAGEPSGAVWLRRIAFLARVDKSRRNF